MRYRVARAHSRSFLNSSSKSNTVRSSLHVEQLIMREQLVIVSSLLDLRTTVRRTLPEQISSQGIGKEKEVLCVKANTGQY